MKKKRKQSEPVDRYAKPLVVETFNDPWHAVTYSAQPNQPPMVWNGVVSFRKYRITVERIEEPREVLIERIQKLWDECDNHHNCYPLMFAAKELGIELKHPSGTLRK